VGGTCGMSVKTFATDDTDFTEKALKNPRNP